MELLGNVKTYDWGKLGSSSKVASLARKTDKNFSVQEDTPYSELWMGDHISGPSIVKATGETLDSFIKKNPKSVGQMPSLPFLFKVLSIRKPLSLQVHPNKEEAERLHKEFPDIYKDPNHKPELAIALTPFTALCGFRPIEEIRTVLETYPEIKSLVGKDFVLNSDNDLRTCFEAIMRADPTSLSKAISSLKKRFEGGINNVHEKYFHFLDQEFPVDVGSIAMFFLNLVHLKPGESINLEANLPHAYIEGDCIECMACSDNVVRAGLTPKFKDIETLVKMLDYTGKSLDEVIYKPQKLEGQNFTRAFIPKVKDFAVLEIDVPKGEESYAIHNRKFGSILLVLNGNAKLEISDQSLQLQEGSIIFLPATSPNVMPLKIGDTNGFVAYQAMYNDF